MRKGVHIERSNAIHEQHQDLDDPYPDLVLSPSSLERVDQMLLAIAEHLRELARDTTPYGGKVVYVTWPIEEIRTSLLGQRLLLIAAYAEGGYADPTHVEQAMHQVLQTLFGESSTLPARFHTTDLGKLFYAATTRMYKREDLLTPFQVYRELGISRQSVYDRIADGKLHPVYPPSGAMRLLRSDVEAWKAQRKRRDTPG